MGLSLLFPLGLAALAAWLVPLLLHLARRQESRLTEFAALRWLRARPKPRQRIRFDERPLLLVRLLLLALIALLLAGLAWQAGEAKRPRVLVSPGIGPAALHALALPQDARVQWLAEGFPAFDTPMPVASQPVASLLREFDAGLPASTPLTVVVPADWGAVDAQRPQLSRAVTWQVLPGHAAPVAMPAPAPLHLLAVGFDDTAPSLRTLRALQAAWQSANAPLQRATITAPAPTLPAGTLAVWGHSKAPPRAWLDWVDHGGEMMLTDAAAWPAGIAARPCWIDGHGDALLLSARHGRGRLWQLPGGLDPATAPRLLDAGFPLELARHLRPAPAPARVAASDFAPSVAARHWPRPAPSLVPGLSLLIALAFALERWMATSPRRGMQA